MLLPEMWNTLPPEIQEIILREKHIQEAEEMKPIFKEVLEELLEYSFATYLRRSDKYVEKFFGGEGSIFSFNLLDTCCVCNKRLYIILWSKSENPLNYSASHISGYKTLDGKYVCCYKIRESIESAQKGERPIIPLSNYDVESIEEITGSNLEDFYDLLDIPSKYEKERKEPSLIIPV